MGHPAGGGSDGDLCQVCGVDLDGLGDAGQPPVGVDAGSVLVGVGDGDDFAGVGLVEEQLEAGFDGGFRADDGLGEAGFDGFALVWMPELVHRFGSDGRERFDGLIADEAQEALLRGGEEALGFGVCLGSDERDGDDEVRLGKGWAKRSVVGAEVFEVDLRRGEERLRGEVGCEGEGQSLPRGEGCAVGAGAEDRDGDVSSLAWKGMYALAGLWGAEIRLELVEELREVVAALCEVATEGVHGGEVPAGGAAEAEVDAAGINRCQGAELFGDDERGVVGEHDAAAADADGAGSSGDVADEDRGCGAGEAGDAVVLGEPEAGVAEAFGVAGEVDGAGDGGVGGFTGMEADEVENRDGEGGRYGGLLRHTC